MTSTPIAPVVPSKLPTAAGRRSPGRGETRVHRPLPVAALACRPSLAAVYRIAAVDRCGRLAERAVMRALDWTPDSSLDIAETGGALVVRADPAGAFRTTRHGHLVLPARVRRWCGLRVGDRVLLAADPRRQELLVCPPTVLDTMIAAQWTRPVDTLRAAQRARLPEGGELA